MNHYMNKIIIGVTLFLTVLFTDCTKYIPTSPQDINLNLGKILLKIDKENAPANVMLVEAFLARENHDTLYGVMDIQSPTSADILFENVDAGEWNLKVNAMDSSGTILYTGETDLTVLAGILTQVNLTLLPTGLGTGSIYILVTWGTTASNWVDYNNNPVFTTQNINSNPLAVIQSKVVREGSVFKLWYNNLFPNAVTNIGYAESSNGISWQNVINHPVLQPGNFGAWDDHSVQVGAIIIEDSIYKMYYTGMRDPYDYWHIGYATSENGISWTKHNTPVLLGNSIEPRLHIDAVIKVNNTYYMYYSILNPNSQQYYKIGLATSPDGINWTRNPSNPVLTFSQSWEGNGVYFPSVIFESNSFKMVYMNHSSNAFGMATSSDGINWTKNSSNPFFTKEDTNNNWANSISYPNFIKLENEYRIYYTGGHGNQYNSSIGFVKSIGN